MFEKWYKMPHACPDLLAEAVYGLPEMQPRADPQGAHRRQSGLLSRRRCSSASCRSLEAGVVDATHLIADCKSGVSGAGRKAEIGTPVRRGVGQFQGLRRRGPSPPSRRSCRGLRAAARHAGRACVFTPHLTPMIRGIHATLYAPLTTRDVDLQALFEKRYAGEPFVDVMPPGRQPDTRSRARVQHAAASPCTGRRARRHRSRSSSVMDNLVKGAAGQAVQNMNLMFGLPETAGLDARCPCCRRRSRVPALGGAGCARPSASARRAWRCAAHLPGRGARRVLLALAAHRRRHVVVGLRLRPDLRRLQPHGDGGAARDARDRRRASSRDEAAELRAPQIASSRASSRSTRGAQEALAAPGHRARRARTRSSRRSSRSSQKLVVGLEQAAALTDPARSTSSPRRRTLALQLAARARRQPDATSSTATSTCRRPCRGPAGRRRAPRSSTLPEDQPDAALALCHSSSSIISGLKGRSGSPHGRAGDRADGPGLRRWRPEHAARDADLDLS